MSADQLSLTFAALADPTRRAILSRLASGEMSVTELARPFTISLPGISKHLKDLERAGLVKGTTPSVCPPRVLKTQMHPWWSAIGKTSIPTQGSGV